MLSGYLLLAMAAMPQTDTKIDFDCTGKSVENVLNELSKKSGSRMTTVPQLKGEILIASVKGHTITEIKTGIAAAVGGVWKDLSGESQLQLDTERDAREAAEARKTAVLETSAAKAKYLQDNPETKWTADFAKAQVRADQDQARKIMENIRGNNENMPNITITSINSNDQSPATAFLRKIIANLSPDFIAGLPANRRVVFSTRPTAMQKTMPVGTVAMENAFVSEMNVLNAAIKDAPPLDPSVTYNSSLNQSKAVSLPLGKVLLAAKRNSEAKGVNFELIISNPAGEIIAKTQTWLQAEKEKGEESDVAAPSGGYQPSDFNTKLAKALKSSNPGSQSISSNRTSPNGPEFVILSTDTPTPPVDPAALAFVSDPVKNEPQSALVSESLHQFGTAAKKDFIACVPDSLVTGLPAAFSGESMNWEQYLQTLDQNNTRVTNAGPFLVFSPAICAESRSSRVNRAEFSKFFRPLVANGYSRLSEASSYMLAKTWPNSFDASYTAMVSKEADYNIFSSGKMDYLRLFGAMNRVQAQGNQQKFGIMGQPPRAKDILSNLLYNSGGATIIGKGSMVMVSMGDGPKDQPKAPTLAQESTEMFPNGLPQNGVINLNYSETACYFGRSKSTTQGKFFTAEHLGMFLQMKNQSPDMNLIGLDPTDQSIMYQEAMAADIAFNIPLAEGFELNQSLMDGWVTRTQGLSFTQLPADFLAAVEASKKRAAERGMRFGPGKGQNKPPVR